MVRRSRHAWELHMNDLSSETRVSVYQDITAKISAAIRDGVGEFCMPWHGSGRSAGIPINAATQARYRGVNILALWVEAAIRGFAFGYWASYRQWKELGAQVRAGERGSAIVFYKTVGSNTEEDDEGESRRFVARASWVFNVAQVDGWIPPRTKTVSSFESIKEVDSFVKAIGAEIRHGTATAQYRRDLDCIELPERECFVGTPTSTSTESYYAVLLHELTHWSGAPHRLDRQFGKRFGDRAYAMEELVAELGAAFLCASLGIAVEPRPDHAAYVASWLEVLDRDHKAIFTAASLAQIAVEYLSEASHPKQTTKN